MRIIFSAGDMNGVGLEIFHKLFSSGKPAPREHEYSIACNRQVLDDYFSALEFPFEPNDHGVLIGGHNIAVHDLPFAGRIGFGKTTAESGRHSIASLELASGRIVEGTADAVVTLPISKEACASAGWPYPGQSEFFAAAEEKNEYLMILFSRRVRVALATVHVPLASVAASIETSLVEKKITLLHNSLQKDFGILDPRIAVLGLNPHAGENGEIGREEIDVISPAINAVNKAGMRAEGPFPADGFFARAGYERYDGILAMYHDQGLIPLKMIAGNGGVNFTAGLEAIRTSPDHGTAFDIAGKGVADPLSLEEALVSCFSIYANRRKK